MGSEMLDIVDEDDKVVGHAPRSDIHSAGHIHRTVVFLVLDAEKRLFCNQRAPSGKESYNGYWSIALGGHVARGESYEDAVAREVLEETGWTRRVFYMGSYKKRFDAKDRENVRVYGLVADRAPVLNNEIVGGRYASLEEINIMMAERNFLPETGILLSIYRDYLTKD